MGRMNRQLATRAVFGSALLNLHYPTGQSQASRAVGDEDDGSVREGMVTFLDERKPAFRIKHGGGLVEHQDWRIFEKGAREGDALALAD